MTSRWQHHKQQSEELQREIEQFGAVQAATQYSASALDRRLAALVKQGILSPRTNASAVSHQLQQQVKQTMLLASATILEMRPNSVLDSPWLQLNKLDVSFRIPPANLETLLRALAHQTPRLHVELLSLREAMPGTANALLEARVTLGVWNPSEPLTQLIATPLSVPDKAPASQTPTPVPPELAGLFNATQRIKIQNPNADHYRLTAVTLSANVRIAVIADLLAGTSRQLQEGDQLDAWKVQSIGPDGVTLQSGKLDARLKLASRGK